MPACTCLCVLFFKPLGSVASSLRKFPASLAGKLKFCRRIKVLLLCNVNVIVTLVLFVPRKVEKV